MDRKWFALVIYSALIALSIEASSSFDTISDDELVDRIKSSEFVVALFCKYKAFLGKAMDTIKIKNYIPHLQQRKNVLNAINMNPNCIKFVMTSKMDSHLSS